MYHLPDAYVRNLDPVDFDDHAPVVGACAGWVWQPDVYGEAAAIARDAGIGTIIDVGCGAARKLLALGDEFRLIGMDRPEIVEQIAVPGEWVGVDLEQPDGLPPFDGRAVYVCSDVIEHLVHPEHLVRDLGTRTSNGSIVVLSTPDRPRTRGARHMGPSPNRGHVQEWALGELHNWLRSEGWPIIRATYTRSNDHEEAKATCLVVAASS